MVPQNPQMKDYDYRSDEGSAESASVALKEEMESYGIKNETKGTDGRKNEKEQENRCDTDKFKLSVKENGNGINSTLNSEFRVQTRNSDFNLEILKLILKFRL